MKNAGWGSDVDDRVNGNDWWTSEKPSSVSPACSIATDRHETLKPVIEYAEQLGFPQTKDTLHSERDSFMALVDALDLRLKWLERQGQ